MSTARDGVRAACAVFATIGVAAAIWAQPGQPTRPAGTEPYQALRAATSFPRQNLYRGTADCEQCHTRPTPRQAERGVTDRVCLTEYGTWLDSDKHSEAYKSLNSERAERMGRLLGGDVHDPATGCVQCHATSLDRSRWASASADDPVNEGVGCEACHGPSQRWYEQHDDFLAWQQVSRSDKTNLGWTDIHNIVTRAELCNSCHLGSDPLDRRITHAMYAAGHPPLSGFEIESFADKLPRHWRYAHEKPTVGGPSFPRTRNILTASIASVRVAVELAMADAAAPPEQGRWPELARLDCFACHHDLREPSWRQLGSRGGRPGRPRLTVGCLPLVELAVEVAAGAEGDDQFRGLLQQLQAPFEQSAFGDPRLIQSHGAEIVAWCRATERRLQAKNIDAETAVGLLHAIADQASTSYHDFDTARQLFGAWMVVYGELAENKALPLDADRVERMNALVKRVEGKDFFVLERERQTDPCANPPEKWSVEDLLPDLFNKRVQFDPAAFARLMARFDALTSE